MGSKELPAPEMSSVLFPPTSRERRSSPSNNTRRSSNPGPGNSVGMSVKGIAKDEKVAPGDIIYLESEGELKPIKSFTALVAVQEHPGVLKAGYCPIIFSRTAKVACRMTKILWKQ